MIYGIGVDILRLHRIERILTSRTAVNFMNKVLSKDEHVLFSELTLDRERAIFVGCRWSVKECLVKAFDQKKLIFDDVSLLPKQSHNNFFEFETQFGERNKDILNDKIELITMDIIANSTWDDDLLISNAFVQIKG